MRYLSLSFLMFIGFVANSQENNQPQVGSLSGSMSSESLAPRSEPEMVVPEGTAIVNQERIDATFQYTFESNRLFDEELKERWEYRFPISFPYIIDFSMDVATQRVTILLPDSHSEEELLKLIKRFSYLNYAIN